MMGFSTTCSECALMESEHKGTGRSFFCRIIFANSPGKGFVLQTKNGFVAVIAPGLTEEEQTKLLNSLAGNIDGVRIEPERQNKSYCPKDL